MKIVLDKTTYLTKEDIDWSKDNDISEEYYKVEPLVLKNLEVYENKSGQICIQFETKNHKYLELSYGMSSSCNMAPVDGEDEDKWHNQALWSKAISIGSCNEVYWKGEDHKRHHFYTNLWLVPESEEEMEKLSGIAVFLPSKWRYEICIVPYEDFYDPSDEKNENMEVEEDRVYIFGD